MSNVDVSARLHNSKRLFFIHQKGVTEEQDGIVLPVYDAYMTFRVDLVSIVIFKFQWPTNHCFYSGDLDALSGKERRFPYLPISKDQSAT